jgi:CheY-like chemotaxis protein
MFIFFTIFAPRRILTPGHMPSGTCDLAHEHAGLACAISLPLEPNARDWTMGNEAPLRNKRLMVVEDEFLVATELAYALEEMGAEITAMTGHLAEAMKAADQQLDGALIDVQLGSEKSYPLVEKLSGAGVPFILITGYDTSALPEHMQELPRLDKPFAAEQLTQLAGSLFNRRAN